MNKKLIIALLAPVVLALPGMASAAPCKDAKGKFIKCPPAAAAKSAPAAKPSPAAKPTTAAAPGTQAKPGTVKRAPCRDAKGRFKKC